MKTTITVKPKCSFLNLTLLIVALTSLFGLAGLKSIVASLIFVAMALITTKLEVIEESDERFNGDANATSEGIGARRSKTQGNAELS